MPQPLLPFVSLAWRWSHASTTVVARSGEEVVARISALDPEGDTNLTYRLVLDSGATGIVVLLDPTADNVEPGTFRFRATSDVSGPFLNQPFDVIVSDSDGAEGSGAIYTVVVNADGVKSFTGIESSSLEDADNFDPVGVPTQEDAILLPPLTPNAPTDAGDVEVGAVFIGNNVTHDLSGAGIYGDAVFSASPGTGTLRLERNPDLAGDFPNLRFVRGGRLLGATAAAEVFIASAPTGETAPSLTLGLNTLSTQRDVVQTPRGAGFQMAKSPDRDLLPVLFVGRDLRLDGGQNDFQSGDIYIGRSLLITGTSFQPGSGMTLTFTGVSGAGEIRLASPGQSFLPNTVIRPEATVTFQSSLRVNGDLDVDGTLSVFSGNTVDVEGTLRLRRNFVQGEGPFGQLRANQCDISPFVETPTWVTCLGVAPPVDAGGEPDPEPNPEPPVDGGLEDGGIDDGGLADAGHTDGGTSDGGVNTDDAGNGGLDDGGLVEDGGGPPEVDGGPNDSGVLLDAGPPPSVPLPDCPQNPTLPPAPVHNVIVHRVGAPGGVVLDLQVPHALLPPGGFESFSSFLGGGAATGRVTVEDDTVFLDPPELPTDTSFYVRYLDSEGEAIAGVCIDLLALDGENFYVLEGASWVSAGSWVPSAPPNDQADVLVDRDGVSVAPSSSEFWSGSVYVSHRSGLNVPTSGGTEPGFVINNNIVASGPVTNPLAIWSSTARGQFDVIWCDDAVTLSGNVIAEGIELSPYGGIGCALDVGPHQAIFSGDVDIPISLEMTFPTSLLYIGGNATISWMDEVRALNGRIIFAGDFVAYSFSQPILSTLTAVGEGDQGINVENVYDLSLLGEGVATIQPPLTVINDLVIDQEFAFQNGSGGITTTTVTFLENYPYTPGDPLLLMIDAGGCNDDAWVAANGGASGPCDDIGQ